MLPFDQFSSVDLAGIRGVLADIDDTLTTSGKLTAEAYTAMQRLHDAGLLLIPITGRPAGWCDHIARMWPVDGVVGENGAFYFRHAAGSMIRRYALDDDSRNANRQRFLVIAQKVLRTVPGCAVAADQSWREADLAIDFCEDVARLPDAAIDRIAALMRDAGLTAKVSSIHVNGWFGGYDKLTTTRAMLQECFGIALDTRRDEFLFVGDSPNDQPLFEFFPHSVGVANVADFAARITRQPAYVTRARCGAGFAEVAGALLAARAVR